MLHYLQLISNKCRICHYKSVSYLKSGFIRDRVCIGFDKHHFTAQDHFFDCGRN
jgi:hypothetical protein